MAVVFSWRCDTTTAFTNYGASAYRGMGGTTLSAKGLAIGGANMGITANASAIGGKELDFSSTNQKQINFPGNNNFGTTGKFSILISYRGITPSNGWVLSAGGPRFVHGFGILSDSSGNWVFYANNDNATAVVSGQTLTLSATTKHTTTSTSFRDLLIQFDMQTTTGALTWYYDSSLMGSTAGAFRFLTSTADFGATVAKAMGDLIFFQGYTQANQRGFLQEFVIFDTLVDPTSVTLVSPAGVTSTGALNGAARTSWVDCAPFNGAEWTSITAAQIKTGINQVQAGLTQTGTYTGADRWTTLTTAQVQNGVSFTANGVGYTGSLTSEVWSTLTAAQIRSGINQIQNSVTVTGTFAGETWSTLAASDIRLGTNQIQNSVTVTGTLVVPTAVSGTAATVNIGNIKEQIRYVLAQNNTSSGAEVTDLSGNMTNRVANVFKYNPEKIPLSAHMLPAVYIFTDQKSITPKTIAKDQVTGKREATLSFNIAGAVWNPLIVNQNTVDPADEDLEKLMENIERIIRSYSDLGTTVRWQFPEAVTYHSIPIDEQSHLRVSYMKLSCKVFY